MQIVKPFFQDIFRQDPGPRPVPPGPAGYFEIALIYRAQQFGPQNRHVFRIAGAQVKMAFIGAGATPDTDVEKDLQGTEPLQPILHTLEDDFLPVAGQMPIFIGYFPISGIRIAHFSSHLCLSGIDKVPVRNSG